MRSDCRMGTPHQDPRDRLPNPWGALRRGANGKASMQVWRGSDGGRGWMFTYSQGKAARLQAGARRSSRSILLGRKATTRALILDHGASNCPCSKRRNPHLPWEFHRGFQVGRLSRSGLTAARESQAEARPSIHVQAGKSVGAGRERARGPAGERRIPEAQPGPPGADSPAVPGDAAGRRPRASEEVPSPARRHPAGLGPAPRGRGAKGPRDSGAALTQKEAKEVEADEQRPLAAALPRVVVERRTAAVLALRDDRLVVLVVLHGAGLQRAPPAPRRRPATADKHPDAGLVAWPRLLGRAAGRPGSGGRREARVRFRCLLPTQTMVFSAPLGCLCFLPLSTPDRSKVQEEESQIPSRKFCRAALLGARRAGGSLGERASEWAARALGHLPPQLAT